MFGLIGTALSGLATIAKPVIKVAAGAAGVLTGAGLLKPLTSSGGGGGGLANKQLKFGGMTLPSMGSLVPVAAGAAAGAAAVQQSSPGGLPVPFWKGPGGKLQMPWSDPRIPEYLKQFALDDAYLTLVPRAPKGYVVIYDANRKPFAVNKEMAKAFGLWKPKKKPPISVSDWQAFKKAERVEKKLKKIAGPALRKRGYKSGGSARATATATARTRRK